MPYLRQSDVQYRNGGDYHCAEHILLAAAEQGVGACWCHVYEREGAPELTRQLFDIPEDKIVLCAIALGYPDEERQKYDLDKLKYEKIHNEKY